MVKQIILHNPSRLDEPNAVHNQSTSNTILEIEQQTYFRQTEDIQFMTKTS